MALMTEIISALDNANLPRDVFGDGRYDRTTNEEYWNKLQVGDKVYPTVWFLRDFYNPEKAIDAARNGLIISEKKETVISGVNALSFSQELITSRRIIFNNTVLDLDFNKRIAQQIWKIESVRLQKIKKLKNENI